MANKMDAEQLDRLKQLREERIAREKARIEKLRELNLKKYSKNEPQTPLKQSVSSVSVANRPVKSENNHAATKTMVKNNFSVNGTSKRPVSAPTTFKNPTDVKNLTNKNTAMKSSNIKTSVSNKNKVMTTKTDDKALIKNEKPNDIQVVQPKSAPNDVPKKELNDKNADESKEISNAKIGDVFKKELNNKSAEESKKVLLNGKSVGVTKKELVKTSNKLTNIPRKSVAAASGIQKPTFSARKSLQPPKTGNANSRQSVFERLYKPKVVPKETVTNAVKLQTDPNYLKKVIRDSNLLLNKRHTVFENRASVSQPVRRSISAVHFKRISKNELSNCIHKWASIGEKLNKVNLNDINEDDNVKDNIVVSAVKSERKKVKFQTPIPHNLNTPTPEELQSRLQIWLQKRGKSMDSYHHLQCFGLHHLNRGIRPLEPPKFELYDDENKENVPLESDSDDDSYTENVNGQKEDLANGGDKVDFNKDKWRRASYISDSATEHNESTDTIASNEVMHHVDELLFGALNDLTQLLREGFDWEQCARWLRAIRDRFPSAPDSAAYWECRAALEERRGDLPASVQCWEEAIAMGTEHSVVEANLDQLLDKFLQLRISPSSGRRRQADPKMLDVKNVFKSTIIRFAVQQAKLRQSNQSEQTPMFTVTPVRRSARLSVHSARATPLRVCTTVRQACELGPAQFRPNRTLTGSP